MQSTTFRNALLPVVCVGIFGMFLIDCIGLLAGFDVEQYTLFYGLIRLLSITFVIVHSIRALGTKRALFFLGTSAGIGFILELVGLTYGVLFGTGYVYKSYTIMIGPVPLVVPLFWAVFIYTAYSITNIFFLTTHRQRPSAKSGFLSLIFACLLDAILVVAIDVLLDPFEVARGSWVWFGGGPWYGVPLGNYVGWFIVAFLASFVFRFYEYIFPRQFPDPKKIVFHAAPVVGYLLVNMKYTIGAFYIGHPELGIVGALIIIPVIVCILLFQSTYKTSDG